MKEQIHTRSNMTYGSDFETPLRKAESLIPSNVDPNITKWNVHSNNESAVDSTSHFPFTHTNSRNLVSPDPVNSYHPITTKLPHEVILSRDANTSLSHIKLRPIENRPINNRLITRPNLASVKPRSDNGNNIFRISDSGTYDDRSISWTSQP